MEPKEKRIVEEAFKDLMDLIDLPNGNEVRAYWEKRLHYIISARPRTPKSGPSPGSNSPIHGGMKDNIIGLDRKKELTSFGYIDYDKLYKSIRNDEAYKFIQKYFMKKTHSRSMIKSIPKVSMMVQATAGGKLSVVKRRKNKN
jgi:hypothetical protein